MPAASIRSRILSKLNRRAVSYRKPGPSTATILRILPVMVARPLRRVYLSARQRHRFKHALTAERRFLIRFFAARWLGFRTRTCFLRGQSPALPLPHIHASPPSSCDSCFGWYSMPRSLRLASKARQILRFKAVLLRVFRFARHTPAATAPLVHDAVARGSLVDHWRQFDPRTHHPKSAPYSRQ